MRNLDFFQKCYEFQKIKFGVLVQIVIDLSFLCKRWSLFVIVFLNLSKFGGKIYFKIMYLFYKLVQQFRCFKVKILVILVLCYYCGYMMWLLV